MPRSADLPLDLEERRRLLDEWVETRRAIARLEAQASALLTERITIHDADVDDSPFHRDSIHRALIAEYAAAGHLPQGSMEFAFADASAIDAYFPAVRAAFTTGEITAAHAREIVRAGALVAEAVRNDKTPAETLAVFEAAVLVVAESDTAARTRSHARQVAAALIGESLRDRHARAADERSVRVRSLDDGLAVLTAVLPEHLALAIQDRLTQMAREMIRTRGDLDPVLPCAEPLDAIFGDDDTFTTDPLRDLIDPLTDPQNSPDVEHVPADRRTLDQTRADLLIDLLLAADPGAVHRAALDGIQARIQVTIGATTLAGADDRPGELDGHGPLHPDIARDLAARNTGWSRLFLDSSGMVVETDTYSPTESMRRFLRARDQHCRFPGCRMPVHRCDIDHHHDHAKGGKTRLDNLGHLCRGHHALKHPDVDERHRWSARALPGGVIEWTSPLGRDYEDHPPRRVMFV